MIKRTLFLILTAMSLLTGPTSAAYGIYPALPQTPPGDFEVTFYPVAPYHTGDLLSARVAYTGSANIGGTHITVALADEPDQILETAAFSQNTRQATFYWMYDTRSHQTGYLSFRFEVPDFDLAWTQGVHLLPDLGNRSAAWSSAHSPCCTLHYFTGTDAEADLPEIITALEESSAEVLSQFAAAGVLEENPIQEPLSIVLVPMVIGHGGFATDEAVLTYTHDNWAGIEFTNLAHHEIVHVVDRLINTQGPRPSIFVEGLAVYLSGGHYRPGDALQRGAALLALDLYLPISEIVDDFYAAQHEIGYMQAAALVAYLDQLWGWETFIDFYFNLPEGESDSAIISTALEARFGIGLNELEGEFIAYLETLERDPQVEADVRLTVDTYDLLRRYQALAIPSAHFRTAWWPPVNTMRENSIVGDYAYREKAPLNLIVESLFIDAHAALDTKAYARAGAALTNIDEILTWVEMSGGNLSHYSIGWPVNLHPRSITWP
jgi:hypothetical protein